MADRPIQPKKVVALRVGNTVVVTEVFEVTPEAEAEMTRSPCIDACNGACSPILWGDACWGDPSGHKVAAFYKQSVV